MRRLGVSGSVLGMLACLILLTVRLAPAKEGIDFPGSYELSNATDLGEEFRVTLTVRVFNLSGAAVSGATITLEDQFLDKESVLFRAVPIRDHESIKLSNDVTVSRAEYEHWQEGGTPRLRIEFKDAGGETVQGLIDLVDMPVGEEQ